MDDRLHRFVFVFGLLFGGSLIFLSPPYSVPDESSHFYRAYHLSQGRLYASKRDGEVGDDLPSSLTESYAAIAGAASHDNEFEISWAKIEKASAIALDPQRQRFTNFSNMALYSPVAYSPQAVAIWLARHAEQTPLRMFYMARLANLIVYLLLASTAVRLAPIHKWTLALAALIPMSVYLAASLSADAMTLGLSLLVVALTLHLALGSEMPRRRDWMTLGTVLALLALSKQAYVGLALLVFAIPEAKFSSPRRRWPIVALMIGAPLAIDAAWSYSLRGLYIPQRPLVDPPAQFGWILNHPWSYLATLSKSLYRLDTYSQVIGVFGWGGSPLPRWICGTYWAALGFTAVLDGGKPIRLGLGAKAVVLGTYVFTAAMMATLVFLSWESVGSKGIGGLQPRYFLPIIPLLLLLPRGSAKLISSRFSRTVVPLAAISIVMLAAGATWWTLVKRYYW